MTTESTIIIKNIDQATEPGTFISTEKIKGSGHYRKHGSVQTFQFDIDQFKGSIIIQGTLQLYPGESDWIDLKFQSGLEIAPADSSASSGSFIRNIQGNWVWIRLKYNISEGSITQVFAVL